MLEYKVLGNDPSKEYVLFLHGIGGSANIFFPQLKTFRKSFNLIVVNLPGHKNSPSLASYKQKFSFEHVTEDILDVLDEIGVDKVHFVGISLGSVIIHKILEVAPHRVATAVLGGSITRINIVGRFLLLWGTLLKNVTPHLWLYSLCARILMPNHNHKDSRDAFIHEASQMKREDFLGWYDIVYTVPDTFKNVEAKASHIPKLYVTGKDDHMFKKDIMKDTKSLSNTSILILSNSGHVVNLDQPDVFNEAALSFLHSHGEMDVTKIEDNIIYTNQ
ncbi:Pimeloyl-ACP methyl ester carboxylesterase [Halobacillus karajensis]|uniref:Dihydrolipoyllysine-residue acetyltransferase component of acetoin cleaving system n=1 Tax=Halobacillus karajensis TaxID=195088 RepID=A0A024P9F7_9BACI|nr:alpha/beta hydrolase [Halobacillus karajensis]CDQ20282.1 Dihydrolipoyllysine-residue acetyltransferase component of acetoin cleaving system [Halobacillus karajensis]CDQ25057.1 Dihydrolipoyllysine-residue acetyltransferase component of acetoin cleaving system [Halobacillus karajensis]CDQ28582.1 Dihydrolipoyllysine-residue acetyltransferase component of acetoin cleaving system [Halobacillus karajensis]SEI11941.1 Pimeloyl-ACP methyl ester carboxylesterase [Halobacillus karajensis]